MKLSYDNGFAVAMFHSESIILIDSTMKINVPAHHQILLNCKDYSHNIISDAIIGIIAINSNIIIDYLHSNNLKEKNVSCRVKNNHWEFMIPCEYRELFSLSVQLSSIKRPTDVEVYYKKNLYHMVLHSFSKNKNFIPYLAQSINLKSSILVKNLISSDIRKHWSLESVATLLYVSTSKLKKSLNLEGSSFSKILTDCRMQYAANLLLTNDHLVISKLAEQCGYGSLSYFICAFKNYYGITPYQYSKKENSA
ncbi:MAG: helix-turn-helix domain-containing protein [Citrobacter sp.]|uniref:helix-turn-helix domain-containing protein n=1 Tax=Citrobacter sp. TaxID=1896336 RepID=UPI002FC988EF